MNSIKVMSPVDPDQIPHPEFPGTPIRMPEIPSPQTNPEIPDLDPSYPPPEYP